MVHYPFFISVKFIINSCVYMNVLSSPSGELVLKCLLAYHWIQRGEASERTEVVKKSTFMEEVGLPGWGRGSSTTFVASAVKCSALELHSRQYSRPEEQQEQKHRGREGWVCAWSSKEPARRRGPGGDQAGRAGKGWVLGANASEAEKLALLSRQERAPSDSLQGEWWDVSSDLGGRIGPWCSG